MLIYVNYFVKFVTFLNLNYEKSEQNISIKYKPKTKPYENV